MNWVQHANPLMPSGQTAHGSSVDLLFVGLLASAILALVLLFFLLLRFAIHYRAGNARADRDHRIKKSWKLETAWTAATLVAFLALFIWGARLYLDLYDVPKDADADLRRRQAMDVEGPAPRRPARNQRTAYSGRSRRRLIMSSQDVIHSFFIPAFRVKHDVVPGRPQKSGSIPARPASSIFSARNIAAPIIPA